MYHGHGHGHGIFILATHPKGKKTTNPNNLSRSIPAHAPLSSMISTYKIVQTHMHTNLIEIR
jgi:hypothetical protein